MRAQSPRRRRPAAAAAEEPLREEAVGRLDDDAWRAIISEALLREPAGSPGSFGPRATVQRRSVPDVNGRRGARRFYLDNVTAALGGVHASLVRERLPHCELVVVHKDEFESDRIMSKLVDDEYYAHRAGVAVDPVVSHHMRVYVRVQPEAQQWVDETLDKVVTLERRRSHTHALLERVAHTGAAALVVAALVVLCTRMQVFQLYSGGGQ